MFYFGSNLRRFVLAGGGARKQSHVDTEFFGLETLKWLNVYTLGAPYTVETGPTDAPSADDHSTSGCHSVWCSLNRNLDSKGGAAWPS